MKMPVINFDEHFADFMSEWLKSHQDQYANFDEMEEDMPRIYMAFLNTRAKWLGNVTPGAYFTQFEDPKVLVDWLAQYCEDGVPVPDLLCEQITAVGRPCEKRLLELLKDDEAPEEARMTAVNLLREMESTLPKMLYIQWQLNRGNPGGMQVKNNRAVRWKVTAVYNPWPVVSPAGQPADPPKQGLPAHLEMLQRHRGNHDGLPVIHGAGLKQQFLLLLVDQHLHLFGVPQGIQYPLVQQDAVLRQAERQHQPGIRGVGRVGSVIAHTLITSPVS